MQYFYFLKNWVELEPKEKSLCTCLLWCILVSFYTFFSHHWNCHWVTGARAGDALIHMLHFLRYLLCISCKCSEPYEPALSSHNSHFNVHRTDNSYMQWEKDKYICKDQETGSPLQVFRGSISSSPWIKFSQWCHKQPLLHGTLLYLEPGGNTFSPSLSLKLVLLRRVNRHLV